MSAFMVSEAHIQAIMNYAVAHRMYWWETDPTVDIGSHNASYLGQKLVDANAASIRARYGDESGYVYAFELKARTVKPVEFLKALQCLDYQSCEVKGWHETEAYKTIQFLTDQAVHHIEGYDAAAWEISA